MMGKRPKLFWWQKLLTFLLSFSLLFSQFLSFSVKPVLAAGKTYDMATSTNYNIRIDGAGAASSPAPPLFFILVLVT